MTQRNPPNPKIITNAHLAEMHNYLIMGKSKAGRHINMGFSQHRHWGYSLNQYLYTAELWLNHIDGDCLDMVSVVVHPLLTTDHHQVLDKGLNYDDVTELKGEQPTQRQPDPKAWQYHKGSANKTINDAGILTCAPFTDNALPFNDSMTYGDHLLTVVTDKGCVFMFSMDSFSNTNITDTYGSLNNQHLKPHKAKITKLLMTRADKSCHIGIIKGILANRQPLQMGSLTAFINPSAPNTPPTPTSLPKSPNKATNETFQRLKPAECAKLTDFNDLMQVAGKQEVKKQITHAIDHPRPLNLTTGNPTSKQKKYPLTVNLAELAFIPCWLS